MRERERRISDRAIGASLSLWGREMPLRPRNEVSSPNSSDDSLPRRWEERDFSKSWAEREEGRV